MKINPKYEERYLKDVRPSDTMYTDLMDDIMDRVVMTKFEKGLTTEEIANVCGVDYHTMREWLEYGHNFTLHEIALLSEAIGEPIIQLTEKVRKVNKEINPKYFTSEHKLLERTMNTAWGMVYELFFNPEIFKDYDKERLAELFQKYMSVEGEIQVMSMGSTYTYIKYLEGNK